MSRGKKKTTTEIDEVEELLRAAEDENLLKLSVDSHISRGSSSNSYLDPDLDRRFQALRSKPGTKKPSLPQSNVNPNPNPKPPPSVTSSDEPKAAAADDDLFARFAALKGSLPSYSSPSASAATSVVIDQVSRPARGGQKNDDVDEDEVDKLIRWAVDAARLDPSPPSDSDEDQSDHSDVEDDDDDDSEDDKANNKGRKKR